MKRAMLQALKPMRQKPWPPAPAPQARLDPYISIEEETSPFYTPSSFYPAHLGDILGERYQLATKLGYGSRSTVWLARDLHRWQWLDQRFVAIKIKTAHRNVSVQTPSKEVSIHEHISKVNSQSEGKQFVRHLLDHFIIGGEGRWHECLVFEPLREPLWLYRRRFPGEVIPSFLLKIMLQMLLHALDFLHSECEIIHTDLKPDNVMVKLEDSVILTEDVQSEFEEPLPQKHCEDGRTIYLSRNNYGPSRKTTGIVRISDFDMAVHGSSPQEGCIQAEIYRAPESILNSGFSYSADIWNLGVLLWDLLEGTPLFKNVDPHHVNSYNDADHLMYITKLLGPPPPELLARGKRTNMFYTSDGELKLRPHTLEDFSFEATINHLEGEDKKMFVAFVKRMIKWRPEDRSTAKQLLDDPWLYADFD